MPLFIEYFPLLIGGASILICALLALLVGPAAQTDHSSSSKPASPKSTIADFFVRFQNTTNLNPAITDVQQQLQDALVSADVGWDLAQELAEQAVSSSDSVDALAIKSALEQRIAELCYIQESGQESGQESRQEPQEGSTTQASSDISGRQPLRVVFIAGVNGAGKTTSIGKLVRYFQKSEKTVMLAACDTFRAAAIEQLQAWGNRLNVRVVAQQRGADAAAVMRDAIEAAQSAGIDVLIVDTAGRLQKRDDLMRQLEKMLRVANKTQAGAPTDRWLVIDGATGRNALSQIAEFNNLLQLNGLIVTKMDNASKAGFIVEAIQQYRIPVRFLGYGESAEDLEVFDSKRFAIALTDSK